MLRQVGQARVACQAVGVRIEVDTMFGWLRRCRERSLERQIERLLAENRAMKAEWRKLYGDEPPR
jgi:hypothetical protein